MSVFYLNNMPFRYANLSLGGNRVEERKVEVALGNFFRKLLEPQDVLEVGNVLHQYASPKEKRDWHTVVDLNEKFPHVTNADIREWRGSKYYKVIISLSTIEHVGNNYHDKLTALENMKMHLDIGGLMFVTIPIGWRDDADQLVQKMWETFDGSWFICRTGESEWIEIKPGSLDDLPKYGSKYKRANSLYLGVYRK